MTIQPSIASTSPIIERELTANQRNLVDTCFEEGNYEAAISLMDQLRHPCYRPHETHVRNLIYIALYPPRLSEELELKVDIMSASPTKMSRITAKSHKDSHTPTPDHSADAMRTLNAFAQTNTPASLCRALPSFDRSAAANSDYSRPDEGDGWESDISRRSRCIVDAKSCWEILKEGFIQLETPFAQDAVATPSARLRRSRRITGDDSSDSGGETNQIPDPVGMQAWPLLDWILTLLERDEVATRCDHVQYSALLLSQIPPSRSPSGARWDLEALLDVAFFCIRIPSRTMQGARLLVMLINLASTTYIDLTITSNTLSNRMMSLSPGELQAVFARLPDTFCCLQFKLALCKTMLSTNIETTTVKPKPRAAPRPLSSIHKQSSSKDLSAGPQTSVKETVPSIARKYPPVTAMEVVRLVSSTETLIPHDKATNSQTLEVKFQLLCAYGRLQELGFAKDDDWEKMLQNSELARAIETGFGSVGNGSPADQARAQDLKAILTVMGWYR